MFAELLPILRNRPVMLTLALVGDNAIRVNVIPKRVKEDDPKLLALICRPPETFLLSGLPGQYLFHLLWLL